jgi:hypothetical protein
LDSKYTSKAICPGCGSEKTIPILWGYPAPDCMDKVLAAVRRGEIELGGCLVTGNDATDHCKKCGHDFILTRPFKPLRVIPDA